MYHHHDNHHDNHHHSRGINLYYASATLQQRLSKALANAKQSTMLQHVTSDWDTTPVCYGKA